MVRISFFNLLVVLVLLAGITQAGEAPPPGPALSTIEPPAEYTLHLDDQTIDIRLDQTLTLTVNGRPVKVKLTAKATKPFEEEGISFRYPAHHTFGVEKDPDGLATWTFDGANNVIILMRQPRVADPAGLRQSIVEGMVAQYGANDTRTAKTRMKTPDTTLEGTRVRATVAGTLLVQDVFAWTSKNATFALIIQDTLTDDGSTTEETKEVQKLLEKTLKVGQAQQ